ncbi:hypothetical protein Mapa_011336 [Marchantia paleacea]|nr:hypothetical protein Mapa_011336 [Marchantia paleacea]
MVWELYFLQHTQTTTDNSKTSQCACLMSGYIHLLYTTTLIKPPIKLSVCLSRMMLLSIKRQSN